MTKSRIFISTITMIAFATVFTGCPMNGNGTGVRQINVTIEEINFRTVGDFTQEEIDAIQAELDTLTVTQLTSFANYVSSVTLAQNVTNGLVVTIVGAGAQARAAITIDSAATAQELVAALEAGRAYIRGENNNGNNGTDPSPKPAEFLTLTFDGYSTVLKAMPGIDQATIDAIRTTAYNAFHVLADDMDRRVINHVASWTLVEETIDGGWEIVGHYTYGRTIVISNNSSTYDWGIVEEIWVIGNALGSQRREGEGAQWCQS